MFKYSLSKLLISEGKMAELKVEIPEQVKEEIKKYSDIEWSKVFEKAVKRELRERSKRELVIYALDKILENSKLTEEDALRLGDELKERVWKRHQAEGW